MVWHGTPSQKVCSWREAGFVPTPTKRHEILSLASRRTIRIVCFRVSSCSTPMGYQKRKHSRSCTPTSVCNACFSLPFASATSMAPPSASSPAGRPGQPNRSWIVLGWHISGGLVEYPVCAAQQPNEELQLDLDFIDFKPSFRRFIASFIGWRLNSNNEGLYVSICCLADSAVAAAASWSTSSTTSDLGFFLSLWSVPVGGRYHSLSNRKFPSLIPLQHVLKVVRAMKPGKLLRTYFLK